jgi:ComF family protein
VWLDGGAREIAHRLKYDGWWRAADAMAETMVEAARCLEPLTGKGFLVPIPLGVGRGRERGYNQSERLATALADRLGLEVRAELLARGRETRSQTALTPEERRVNVAGAFRAGTGAAGAAVILVDDVFTTGATLVAAAAALVSAGATRIDAVTFARAVAPVDQWSSVA